MARNASQFNLGLCEGSFHVLLNRIGGLHLKHQSCIVVIFESMI